PTNLDFRTKTRDNLQVGYCCLSTPERETRIINAMPIVEIPTSELLRAVERLPPAELDEFAGQVLALRTRHVAPSLDRTESELFEIINQGMSAETQNRFTALKARLQADTMTPQEQAELIQITDQNEIQNARRIEALIALAQHRGVTVRQLMDQLGI